MCLILNDEGVFKIADISVNPAAYLHQHSAWRSYGGEFW